MANEWLRLWHDMPTDPKFRTIAKKAGQSISEVMAVYVHLLVSASRNVTRGHVDVTIEDLASALDVTEDAISSILEAMEGRVIEEKKLTGWEKRQPKREDLGGGESGAKSAAERKREQREREKERERERTKAEDVTGSHEASRNVTLDKDKDKDKETNTKSDSRIASLADSGFESFWQAYPKKVGKDAAMKAWKKVKRPVETLKAIHEALAWQRKSEQWAKDGGQYVPNPATYLNQGRWQDEKPTGCGGGGGSGGSIFAGMV